MIIEEQEQLSEWLVKQLSPICDADPGSLAKYVIALIRKPDKTDDELKEFCLDQLEAFLPGNTSKFVDRLFKVLKEKSYIQSQQPAEKEKKPVVEKREEKRSERSEERERDKERERKGKENDLKREAVPSASESDKVVSPKRSSRGAPPAAPLQGSNDKHILHKETLDREVRDNEPRDRDNRDLRGSRDVRERERERERREPPREREQREREREPPKEVHPEEYTPDLHEQGVAPTRQMRKRISPPPSDKVDKDRRRRSRSPRDRRAGRRRSPERERRRRGSRSRSRSGERDHRRKKRCRDFNEKGFCTRADQCPYDHGPDPVVLDDTALEKYAIPGTAPNFSQPPPGFLTVTSQPPPPGLADAGYNPEAPALTSGANFSLPPPPLGMTVAPPGAAFRPTPITSGAPAFTIPPPLPYDPTSSSMAMDPHMQMGMGGPMRGLRGRGRGRGAVRGRGPYHQPRNNEGKMLEVRKIPVEMNTITKLNEHFSKFGSVVNMQVHYGGDPEAALITYSARGEATNAYKSTEPILNNRFIKVFWHNPPPEPPTTTTTTTTITPSGSIQRTVLASGTTVDVPVPGHGVRGGLPVSPQKPVQEVARKEQTVFRNKALEEQLAAKAEERERRKKEKEQIQLWVKSIKQEQDIINKLLKQQKAAIEIVKKSVDDEEKKKRAMKLIKVTKQKIEASRNEVNRLNDSVMEMRKKHKEEEDAAKKEAEEKKEDGEGASGSEEGLDTAVEEEDAPRTVLVTGFDSNRESELTAFLKTDIGDVEEVRMIQPGHTATALITFTTAVVAETAVAGKQRSLDGRRLKFEWPEECDFVEKVVPQPEQLLANLGNSEESDDEDN